MAKGIGWGIGAVGAALLLASGCATNETKSEPMNPARSAEQASAQALDNAHKAQRTALDAQKRDEDAQKQLQVQREKLSQAEQAATQAHAQAQQLQAQARQETQKAAQLAAANQKTAQSALSQQQKQQAQQNQAWYQSRAAMPQGPNVTGQLVQASPNELVVKTANQPHLSLKVDNQTQATLNGRQVSVTQLPPGAQVRASFDVVNGQFQARQVQAMSQ